MPKIRKPAVAGTFYPGDRNDLANMVEEYLNEVKLINIPEIKALIVPHAGYIYSGQIAASAYKQLLNLAEQNDRKIFLIGASHHVLFPGLSIAQYETYETPLGQVSVNEIVAEIVQEEGCDFFEQAHHSEHCLEVQLPFLQRVLKQFSIIPILMSETDYTLAATILEKYLDSQSLLVVSSDLSHYYAYEEAVKLDKMSCVAIESQNIEALSGCEACGKVAIMTLVQIAKKFGWKSKLVDYRNSGDTAGDRSHVVGYGSFVFYSE